MGQPTPFNNFNQWAADFHGPIWKNHTFFDVDYEGLRNLLPGSSTLTLDSQPAIPNGHFANLAANGNAAEIPFYQQVFKVYNSAPGAGSAVPVTSPGRRLRRIDFSGLGGRRSLCAPVPNHAAGYQQGVSVVGSRRSRFQR